MGIKKKSYPPGLVANYLLDLGERDGVPVTPLKLQKLVYIAFGWALVLYEIQLFDEPIEAWKHGPVIPSLFHEFKVYTNRPIRARSFELHPDGSIGVRSIPAGDRHARKAVAGTWKAYGRLSAAKLRNRTHAPGTPWRQVYEPGRHGVQIPVDLISQHFVQKRKEFLGW